MDNLYSQTKLEFEKIKQLLSECAQTDGAKEAALSTTISSDIVVVRRLLQQTSTAKEMQTIKGIPPFGHILPIADSLTRADKGACLSTLEILRIGNLLRTTRSLQSYMREGNSETNILTEIFEKLLPNKLLESKIFQSILSEDQIADDASPELSTVRRKMTNAQNKIKEVLQRYASSQSKFLQDSIITTREGRYVIPVKAEFRSEVKGIVHDTSSSGSTVFVEPMAVVELNNDIRQLEGQEKVEIEKILYTISSEISAYSTILRNNYDNITELATIFARSELSFRMNACAPEINDNHFIRLNRARHPLIDSKKVVPISLEIGNKHTMMIITGPNTGGKTVTLKTIGLLSMMVQSGLHVPLDDGSSFCVFDSIYSDIGDEQSIEQSLSTFSSHMKSVVSILSSMTENSLVLFDELGAGTDPVEGAALATSILSHVLKTGCLSAVTTHYAELKAFAIEQEKAFNASCEFDVETLRPTYRLIIGSPGRSNAFAISTKLGLSEEIIHNAESLLNQESRDFENVISELEKTRKLLDSEAEKTKKSREEFEAYRNHAEQELKKRLGTAERDAQKMREQAQQTLDSARVTSQYIMSQLEEARREIATERAAEKLQEKRKAIRESINSYTTENEQPISDEDYVLPRDLIKGDYVMHKNLGQKGFVIDVPDKKKMVFVQFANVKMKVSQNDLRLLDQAMAEEKTKAKVQAKQQKELLVKSFKPELDIRGQTGDDGWFMVDHYLEEASFAGVHSVTIIHGKGTGALRTTIWNELKKDKRVVSYRAGQFGEGDYGVTVVSLK